MHIGLTDLWGEELRRATRSGVRVWRWEPRDSYRTFVGGSVCAQEPERVVVGDVYALREPETSYKVQCVPENADLSFNNAFKWYV